MSWIISIQMFPPWAPGGSTKNHLNVTNWKNDF